MTELVAYVVDDSPQDLAETSRAVAQLGFDVSTFVDATSALQALAEEKRLVDLIVLDRQLPRKIGEIATNEVGDELLDAVLSQSPDQKVIVFTGHSGQEHIQFAQSDRGTIELKGGETIIDRVTALGKGQSLEFDRRVQALAEVLARLSDIHVDAGDADLDPLNKRIIRRAAYEYGALSVTARALTGGASGAPVWLCEMFGERDLMARAILKIQRRRFRPGGFQSILPAQLSAGVSSSFGGFCGGVYVTVQQVAGDDPVSLMAQLGAEDDSVALAATHVRAELDSLPLGQNSNISLAEVVAPFGDWALLHEQALTFNISSPAPSKICAITTRLQHGDLHPGNVLLVQGRPVLIDFDKQCSASALLDPVVFALAPLFNPSSPIRTRSWPSGAQCQQLMDAEFFTDCPSPAFFEAALNWVRDRARSDSEMYAVVLGYALKQLTYQDVTLDRSLTDRAVGLAVWASRGLIRD